MFLELERPPARTQAVVLAVLRATSNPMLFMKKPSVITTVVSFLYQNVRLQFWLAPLLLHLVLATTANANVYATNVRLNGGIADVLMPAATNVDISYILNEPASNGVAISI